MASRLEKGLSPYELQRLANIRRNALLMESLGLNKTAQEIKAAARPKPKLAVTPKRKPKPKGQISPSRRSGRKAGEPVRYSDQDLDKLFPRQESAPRRKSSGPRRKSVFVEFTEEQRATLDKADWIDDFHDFLLHIPHGRGWKP